jgi:UDP-glucose 4-epimerase
MQYDECMSVLVTGGGGFVGSHLVEYYLNNTSRDVRVLDNFATGRRSNLSNFRDNKRLSIKDGDIRDEELVTNLVGEATRVYHLAASVGVKRVLDEPIEALETNLRGTENVLRAAADDGTETFIASSSEVYGKSPSVPFAEDDDCVVGPTTAPRWGYATAKAADEFLALAYQDEFGLPVVVGRLFNVVGPRQVGEYGMVIPRFVQQALNGEPLTVYGDGTQMRSFTHVRDAVTMLHRLMETEQAYGEVINVGTPNPVTIQELAETVIELVNSTASITHVPFEEAYDEDFEEPSERRPDLTKLQSLLDDIPQRGLEAILADVIAEKREEV